MKTYILLKHVACDTARRILKPGELWVFDDEAAAALVARGCLERWSGDAPVRAFAPRGVDPELEKLTDNDL